MKMLKAGVNFEKLDRLMIAFLLVALVSMPKLHASTFGTGDGQTTGTLDTFECEVLPPYQGTYNSQPELHCTNISAQERYIAGTEEYADCLNTVADAAYCGELYDPGADSGSVLPTGQLPDGWDPNAAQPTE